MKNRILMFHPTHRTAVNSIAELFPEISFEMALVPEVAKGDRDTLIAAQSMSPLEPNVKILDKCWRDVDDLEYDLLITYPGMAMTMRREWRIPRVLLFLNTEDPIVPGFAWYVANTYSTFAKLSSGPPFMTSPGSGFRFSHIFPTVGRRAVGDWTGEERKAYFMNDKSFSDRQGLLWDRAFMDFLCLRTPFSRTKELLPWSEHMACRRRMRAYVELSRRRISCAFLESMMMGQPVIAPDENDWNLVVTNGRNGLLYGSRDEAADMILSVIEDDEFAKRLGDAGRIRAEQIAGDDVRREAWTKVFTEIRT